MKKQNALRNIFLISLIGIVFSAYLSVMELFLTTCPLGGCSYLLGMPSCVYGFIIFLVIFYFSRKGIKGY